MSADDGATGPAQQRRWLRRPVGLVEQTRWLFCLCVTLSTVLTLPAPLLASVSGTTRLVALAAAAALVGSYVWRYARASSSPVLDLVDALALMAFAAACPGPAAAFAVAFSMLWFRALYGSTRSIVLYCCGTGAGMSASLAVWAALPGHVGGADPAAVVGALPILMLTTMVARHLAMGLFAREQSQQRDAALTQLSSRLLGITDSKEVHRQAWVAATAICEATPGLRVLAVAPEGGALKVYGHAGAFVDPPTTLHASLLPGLVDGTRMRLAADATVLTDHVGFTGQWLCVAMPDQIQGTMLLGCPTTVPVDAQVAIRTMMNQVALAQRASEAHQDLATQAHTDSLTGLANRGAFVAALEAELFQAGEAPALLFVDLDDFKTVNDGMGHAAGDQLLRQVADRLRATVRPEDLCARLGGDEFAVLLRGRSAEVAMGVGRRLVEVLEAPVRLAERSVQVGASIGVAHAVVGSLAEQLVQQADVAMYAAKANGKNQVQLFDPALLRPSDQDVFEAELAGAAAAGQLVVHYQPVLCAGLRRPTALEALVRWEHPVRGRLSPAEFIDAAERTGAIVDIGAAVMGEATAFVAGLRDRLPVPMPIHVNVSAVQLVHDGFVETVRRCVEDNQLVEGQLVLEITESMVLDSPSVRATLHELVAAGVGLAVDDFGTGYSALTTLRTLPLSIVKIDKSFVSGYPASPADHAVVDAIVQMAGRLGLSTVAEGVERVEQQQQLEAAGVSSLQGFLYRRPAPADEIATWLCGQLAETSARAAAVVPLPRRRTG